MRGRVYQEQNRQRRENKRGISRISIIGKTKLFGLIVSSLLFMMFFVSKVEAKSVTQNDAYNWLNSKIGKSLDYDGAYGAQCVDFYNYYLRDVYGINPYSNGAVSYAYQLWDLSAPSGFTKIAGNSNFRVGDIVIWNKGNGSSTGHVGMVYSTSGTVRIIQQNYSGKKYVSVENIHWQNLIRGVLRPTYASAAPKVSGGKQVSVTAGYYILQFANTAKYLDVSATSTNNGANIQIWAPYDSGAQVFRVGRNSANTGYFFQNVASGKFLDTDTNKPGKQNVIQWQGNGVDGQQWVIEDAGGGYVYIRNLYKYYLDAVNATDKNGTNVQVYGFNGSNAQKWKLIRVSGKAIRAQAGKYNILFSDGNRFLDVNGGSKDNGANVQIYKPNGNGSQLFTIARNSANSAHYVQNILSGKFLDTDTNKPGKQNVIQWQGNGVFGQQWVFEDAGGGNIYIRNLYGYYLEVNGGVNEDKRNVQVAPYSGGSAQKFRLVRVSGQAKSKTLVASGDYSLRSKISSKALSTSGYNLIIDQPNTSSTQIFTLKDLWDGHSLVNKYYGMYVDTSAVKAPGSGILGSWTGNKTQNWLIENAGSGYVYIRNLWGYYLTVANGGSANGTRVNVSAFTGSDSQKWSFVKVSSAATTGTKAASAKNGKKNKASSSIKIKGKKVSVKYALIKRKNAKISVKRVFTIKNKKGSVVYKKLKGNKRINISRKGSLHIRKGLKKGTYKVLVKCVAYNRAHTKKKLIKTTIKIRVK